MAINSAKSSSSPGSDGIDYRIIREFNPKLRYCLLLIFNEIFILGEFPHEWNKFIVFFIPKKESNKFRPISLAQCLLKTLERMIYNCLNWWIEFHSLLPQSQFGFRNGKSCIDNLSIFFSDIQLNFENFESTAALFLDIQGAYDNVSVGNLNPKT